MALFDYYPSLLRVGLRMSPRGWRDFALGTGLGLAMSCGLIAALFVGSGGSITWRPSISAGFTFALLLVASIGEEVVSRGPLLRARRNLPLWIIATSVAFAAMHGGNRGFGVVPFMTAGVSGAVFALVVLRTRQLWGAWGLHFGWNAGMAVVFGVPVSGFHFAALGRTVLSESGGAYGIEGTIAAAALWLLALVGVWSGMVLKTDWSTRAR